MSYSNTRWEEASSAIIKVVGPANTSPDRGREIGDFKYVGEESNEFKTIIPAPQWPEEYDKIIMPSGYPDRYMKVQVALAAKDNELEGTRYTVLLDKEQNKALVVFYEQQNFSRGNDYRGVYSFDVTCIAQETGQPIFRQQYSQQRGWYRPFNIAGRLDSKEGLSSCDRPSYIDTYETEEGCIKHSYNRNPNSTASWDRVLKEPAFEHFPLSRAFIDLKTQIRAYAEAVAHYSVPNEMREGLNKGLKNAKEKFGIEGLPIIEVAPQNSIQLADGVTTIKDVLRAIGK